MKATPEIMAREIYRELRGPDGFAPGHAEGTVAGRQNIQRIAGVIKACAAMEFCERCGCALKDAICQNHGCEHQRILADIDATE